MITIALDEYGRFEGLKRGNNGTPFVAGFLFDDCGNRVEAEKERIRVYFNTIIDEINNEINSETNRIKLKYPQALHLNANGNNRYEVGLFKTRMGETIAEFIEYGTYHKKRLLKDVRKGQYYIFANIRSDGGREELLKDNTSILLKDDFGSNLYFHMSTEIVSRVLFHNPIISNIKEVAINLATRSTEDISSLSERANEYKKLGYEAKESKKVKGEVYFNSATSDMYRASLSQSLLESGKLSLKLRRFKIWSISYKYPEDMEFLYLADSICSVLAQGSGRNSEGKIVETIRNTADRINPKVTNLVFTYGKTDIMYKKAWQFFEAADYYESLSIAYDIKKQQDDISSYYARTWIPVLERSVSEKADAYSFIIASKKLQANLKTNSVDQDKTLYIFKQLEKVVSLIGEEVLSKTNPQELYDLYDSGITVYTHIGDSGKASECYEKCRQHAKNVDIDRYLVSLNKITVMYLDGFEWKKAKETAEEGVECQKLLMELKNSLPIYDQSEGNSSVGLGKALSQLGQVYAFERNDEAVATFKHALKCFQPASPDYKITQSYLLHHYLDMGKTEDYEREATNYFNGAEKIRDRFKFILEEAFKRDPAINYKYALYVFVRGLSYMEADTISDLLAEKLYKIDETLKKAEAKMRPKTKTTFEKLTGHPSEIVFKYIALILDKKGRKAEAKNMLEEIDERVHFSGVTVDLIKEYAKAEFYRMTGDINGEKSAMHGINTIIREHFGYLEVKSDDGLSDMMTFMYR